MASPRTSQQIRQDFISFFSDQCGHTHVPSSSVVPHDDPTLLFANAGMNQFKDVFLEIGQRPYQRAVNTQKCIRAGGKHNDLDDVGKDTYHHTFFEMLGNWSFGDYFKKEAIQWAWQLLTDVWGIDKSRLHVTVFEGDPKQGLEPDHEAAELWRTVTDVQHDHITFCDAKDNFWEMGETGPCGPCSEVHIDLTPDKSGAALVNQDDPRVIEIWNLVFIQYNRGSQGDLTTLPNQHVDTGMGLERVCAVMQNKTSNYDTDLWTPIFQAIADVTGTNGYGGKMDDMKDTAYRVIADHMRTLTFALTDGAHCGNEGRSYVLRRILRRAVRYGRQHLNVTEPFLYRLVPVIIETMGQAFPELNEHGQAVIDEIREEELSFGRTLDRGITLFDRAANQCVADFLSSTDKTASSEISDWIASANKAIATCADSAPIAPVINWDCCPIKERPVIDGQTAFTLYDTYGFPLDLTELIAEEQGLGVDVAAYEACMAAHRGKSQGGGSDDVAKTTLLEFIQQNQPAATNFTGYHQTTDQGEVLYLLEKQGEVFVPVQQLTGNGPAALIAPATPFYGESGGQVGDTGEVTTEVGDRFVVTETIKIGDITIHLGQLVGGTDGGLSVGQAITLTVDAARRHQITIHHTTTHLMNWALRDQLGDHIQQRGSLVDEQKTRFDFLHNQAVTAEQLVAIQQGVCQKISEQHAVDTQVVEQEAALEIDSLRAVFGEKYPPKVRVVSIGTPVDQLLANPKHDQWANDSIEFCGGTHLDNTQQAEVFVLLAEEAVAKGVRRLIAVGGDQAKAAIETSRTFQATLDQVDQTDMAAFGEQLTELTQALEQAAMPLIDRLAYREKLALWNDQIKAHRKKLAKSATGDIVEQAKKIAEQQTGPVIVATIDGATGKTLISALDVIRQTHPEAASLLASVNDGKIAFVAAASPAAIERGLRAGDWVRQVAEVVGGRGGGRPEMAQAGGTDVDQLDQAMALARSLAEEKLA